MIQQKNRQAFNKIRIGIAAANFYPVITKQLIAGAWSVLAEHDISPGNVTTVIVPGSFELPLACQRLAETKRYDALIALGCMIRGETDHYHYIMNELSRGVMEVMLRYKIPIGFGVIAAHNLKQAQKRARGTKNYGRGAANAALAMML